MLTGQWRALPDMSMARHGCAAVCIDGNVYVMGGYDGGSFLKSAEAYDTAAPKLMVDSCAPSVMALRNGARVE